MARPASPRNKRYPPVRVLWRLLANEALCEQLRDRAGRSLRPTERGDVYPIGRAGSGGGSLRALLADHPMPVPGEKFHPGQGLLPRAQNLFPIIRAIRQFFWLWNFLRSVRPLDEIGHGHAPALAAKRPAFVMAGPRAHALHQSGPSAQSHQSAMACDSEQR